MAIRLNEFAAGLEHEITILDLKLRLKMEVHRARVDSTTERIAIRKLSGRIQCPGQAGPGSSVFGDYREWTARRMNRPSTTGVGQ
jgi:hypothetical protein